MGGGASESASTVRTTDIEDGVKEINEATAAQVLWKLFRNNNNNGGKSGKNGSPKGDKTICSKKNSKHPKQGRVFHGVRGARVLV